MKRKPPRRKRGLRGKFYPWDLLEIQDNATQMCVDSETDSDELKFCIKGAKRFMEVLVVPIDIFEGESRREYEERNVKISAIEVRNHCSALEQEPGVIAACKRGVDHARRHVLAKIRGGDLLTTLED